MPMQLYAITDRSLLPAQPNGVTAALDEQVERWVAGGVDWIQLRERDLDEEALLALVSRLARIARAPGSRTRLLVNGLLPEAAAAHGAHGVHLRGGATVEAIQHAITATESVSVSCHTLAELRTARAGGATLALWSPVFGKTAQGREISPGSGLDCLREACLQAEPMPIFALGGVSADHAATCLEVGAAGIAAIRLFHGKDWRGLR